MKETTRGTETAIVYDHQKHHHRGLIRELMIEGIVTDMATMADMATGTDMALTDDVVIDRVVTDMVMVVTDKEMVAKRRGVTKISRFRANIIVVLIGNACHRATGACFECGEVGHLAKDCKKGSTSSEGKRFVDSFIPLKRSKEGKRFGFVHFINVFSVGAIYARAPLNRNKIDEKKNVESFRGGVWVRWDLCSHPAKCLDDECLNSNDLSNSLLGRVKEFASLSNLKTVLTNEGFVDISLKQASIEFNPDDRVVWVEVEGVPFKFWSENTFKRLVAKCRELLDVDDQEERCFHSKRLCLYTKFHMNIFENFKMIFHGKVFWVRAKEVPGWVPELLEESHEEDQSDDGFMKCDNKAQYAGSSGDNSDMAEVPETNFDESIGPKVNLSDDPFGIYSLLNKKRKENNENVNEEDQSLKYPPGFTPDTEENDRNVNGDKSQKCNTEEVLAGRNEDSTNRVLRGMLLNLFALGGLKKSEVSCTGGSFLCLMEEVVKKAARWFRQQRSDRFGLIFNAQGADEFNSFIANAGLEEVPLGGSVFTWCHKSATKMSKLDRFLISENLFITCPHITATTLERYLSDHRPILLRESSKTMGWFRFDFFIIGLNWRVLITLLWILGKPPLVMRQMVAIILVALDSGNPDAIYGLVTLDQLDLILNSQFCKGLKQGDPLSPFLFILIMESLHLSFQRVVDAGLFMGIKLSHSVNLSHMFYADDAVFVGQWSDGNINTLIHVLDCFYRASGLKMNMSKSKILGVHVEGGKVKHAASKLGCLTLNTPFSYLGSKVGGSMSRVQAWNHFFNGHEVGSNKAACVKWNSVLTAKDSGGLGVSSLYALNRGYAHGWDNGDMASFWNDNWSGGGVLKDFLRRKGLGVSRKGALDAPWNGNVIDENASFKASSSRLSGVVYVPIKVEMSLHGKSRWMFFQRGLIFLGEGVTLMVIVRDLPVIDMAELVRLQIYMKLNNTWAWVSPGPERQLDVVAGAPEAAEDAHVADEGALGVPAPVQAPQPLPPVAGPARTMAQRLARVEEDVHEIRGALGEQREILDSMAPRYKEIDEVGEVSIIWNPMCDSPHTVSTIKLPILKKGEYDIWAIKMEHYLAHTDYPIWEVIQKGNGPVSVTTDTDGKITKQSFTKLQMQKTYGKLSNLDLVAMMEYKEKMAEEHKDNGKPVMVKCVDWTDLQRMSKRRILLLWHYGNSVQTLIYDGYVTYDGLHAVPLHDGFYMPSGPDVEIDDSKVYFHNRKCLVNNSLDDAPIIEEYGSQNSEEDCVSIPLKK
ncbi:RNA-directed DNA polymerase, eukaryota [Tanacetum coccineum]|uniref:RNA-directed DNA polymerase, eukaryota n=1 Tax=Tanacetum coccineum TaxID=301880 RepID=A0ABQ5A7T6_9ASTR